MFNGVCIRDDDLLLQGATSRRRSPVPLTARGTFDHIPSPREEMGDVRLAHPEVRAWGLAARRQHSRVSLSHAAEVAKRRAHEREIESNNTAVKIRL